MNVSIAQLNRATGCGPVGRGFESLWAYHVFPLFSLRFSTLFRIVSMFKRILFIVFLLSLSLQASNKTTRVIEKAGDVLQFVPVIAAVYSLSIKDYEGLKEFAIGLGSTLGLVLVSKQSLQAISKKYPTQVLFSQRPNASNFQGFPSGHTASVFSTAGFLQKRYGWKFALPTAILGAFVGYSRIQAKKHTPFQVVAGAMLGFATSYLAASRYIDPNKHILSFDTKEHPRGTLSYRMHYSYFF